MIIESSNLIIEEYMIISVVIKYNIIYSIQYVSISHYTILIINITSARKVYRA